MLVLKNPIYLLAFTHNTTHGSYTFDIYFEAPVPIPPFHASGMLPPFIGTDATTADRSPYVTSINDLTSHFGTSPQRKLLLRNLITYRRLLASEGYLTGYQFIDGSFVEDIERIENRQPSDIDIFSFLSAPDKYLADERAWVAHGMSFWQYEVIDREKNKQRFALDTYAILLQEMTAPNLIQHVIYWYSLFSHHRETYAWKGFVAIPLDNAADELALAVLERD